MNTVIEIIILVITYLIGQFSYDTVYLWTLKTITYFTKDKIHFFGKLWDFFGKPEFGLVILLIPILGYLELQFLKQNRKIWLLKYWLLYLLFIVIFYFVSCYIYSLYLFDLIKKDKILVSIDSIHLGNVNLYVIGLFTISLSALSNYLFNRFTIKKQL